MRLAVSNVVPGGVTSLMVIDDNQPARAILERRDLILAPQWSPDSKQIVVGVGGFTAFLDFAAGTKKAIDRVNGGAQVAILNADGTGFHVVTSGENNNGFAAFSPDGSHIVYRTAGPEGEGLRIMNLADHAEEIGGSAALRRKGNPIAAGRPRGIVIERVWLREWPLRGAIGVRNKKDGLGWAQAVEDNPISRKAAKARGRECKDSKKPAKKTSHCAAPMRST